MSLFGLDDEQVAAVMEALVGGPVVQYQYFLRPAVEGSDDKQLAAFTLTTAEGRTGEMTVFIKRCVWKGRSEAIHYRYLTANGVPTPQLYGALNNRDGQEILFLEYLETPRFSGRGNDEWREFFSLLARLNACPITPIYAPHLHPFEQVGKVEEMLWITGVDATLDERELQDGLQSCGAGEEELPALLEAARHLYSEVAAQPSGLLHQDYLADNVGWRGDELVVFDLHKNARGPRFADAAPYLGQLDWSGNSERNDGPGGRDPDQRRGLVQYYLEEYARFGGPVVEPNRFNEEAATLFWAHKVSVLNWLLDHQGERAHEVLEYLRARAERAETA